MQEFIQKHLHCSSEYRVHAHIIYFNFIKSLVTINNSLGLFTVQISYINIVLFSDVSYTLPCLHTLDCLLINLSYLLNCIYLFLYTVIFIHCIFDFHIFVIYFLCKGDYCVRSKPLCFHCAPENKPLESTAAPLKLISKTIINR